MKKILALVSLLTLAAACATQPSGNKDVATNTNANKPAETKSAAAPSESDIIAKEKGSWDAFKRKDADAFGKTLAPDYVQILDNGITDKSATIAGMNDVDLSDVTFSDWKMTPIDQDAVLLTYKTTQKGKYKGKDFPEGPYYEASVYVNRNGEWLAAYYQETLSQPMPQSSAAPKKAASPPATAKAETGPDPIANEKIVWDLFKARDFDGFASLLAPEFMEVEATGVYDKAGSVKGVQDIDASQFELSDWKAMPFDNDAKLVTYAVTMKGAKPMKEYHATIWINRNGKWWGFYHQGTPEASAAMAGNAEKKM